MKFRIWLLTVLMVLMVAASGEGVTGMYNQEMLKQTVPYEYDVFVAGEKGLAEDGSFKNEYFELQGYYMRGFMEYVDSIVNIRGIDGELAENELNYLPCEAPANAYQAAAAFGMRYFYIRNCFYIERMPADELVALRELAADGADPSGEEVRQLIVRTMPEVLTLDPQEPDSMNIILEFDGKSTKNYGIMFGVSISDPYDEAETPENAERTRKQYDFLAYLLSELEEQMSQEMGMPVTVFLY